MARSDPPAQRNGRGGETQASQSISWTDFFDGVHRPEQMGYRFSRGTVEELPPDEPAPPDGFGNPPSDERAAIAVDGQVIGELVLGGLPEHNLREEDRELVREVAMKLAQQIETLRLLEETQRARGEAEQALRRLANQDHSTAEKDHREIEPRSPRPGAANLAGQAQFPLEDDRNEAAAQDAGTAEEPPAAACTLSAAVVTGSDPPGTLLVQGARPFDAEEHALVDTVAQRLGRQVENLRLLEESRHFRGETEAAIRRLTAQSWNAYLASGVLGSAAGYQYDRGRVRGLQQNEPSYGHPFSLRVREEVIGQLSVDAGGLNQEDSGLVEILAERLSAHLDGLRLTDQREQALSETEALYGVSARLSTAQSLEDALAFVSEPARLQGARDSRLFIVSLDERGGPEGLAMAAVWTPEDGGQAAPVTANFLLSDYPAYWRLLQNPFSPTLAADGPGAADEGLLVLLRRSSAGAAAVLPLSINGRWVGVVLILWEQARRFTEQEHRLYEALSRQAAVVVNNRLLLEQTRKRAQELQIVAQVSTAASTILNPAELLQSVVDLTRSNFALSHVVVYRYLEKEGVLEPAARAGQFVEPPERQPEFAFSALPEVDVPGSGSAVARAARGRQVVVVYDRLAGGDQAPRLPGARAEIALPMVVGDRLLGVFDVLSSQPNRFRREDARIFTTLAAQVAVALQNAELYAEQSATLARLRELDHLKSAFLANMSHELRTPLNSILGFAEVLLLELDGPLNELMTNDIHLIEKNGKHLLSLINDVLDMAKIEAGKMNLSFERFLLRDLIDETLDITGSLAREKSLYLVVDPASDASVELVADRVRTRQVLINVIANAVKFTEGGGVTVHVEPMRDERRMQICVQDTGIGIPPDKLDLIFESFSQVNTSTTRQAGGTGLGLPISRRLVEMQGGRLWAESSGVRGEGSLFIVEMPLEAVEQTKL
jgi:signal transduction histidine kinase